MHYLIVYFSKNKEKLGDSLRLYMKKQEMNRLFKIS